MECPVQSDAPLATENRLLATLPPGHRERLEKRAERVALRRGEIVCEPFAAMTHVYFPAGNLLSSVIIMPDGTPIEAAVIGHDGMSGIGMLVNAKASPYRVMQQVDGPCLRVPAADFAEVLADSPPLRLILERYALTLLQQSGQNVACGLSHPVAARMCRWLLECADRVGREDFDITQDFLAAMLGVRRQAVNITAAELQDAGLITYRRGHVALRSRAAVEKSACDCYGVTREMYEELMRIPADTVAA
jgi:CRP-like cAMP-binding protein